MIGLLLLHVGTAAWIGYGAVMKAVEFNPLLLPPPIRDTLMWVVQKTSIDANLFFEWALRAIIGAEVFIALAVLLTRWARQIAVLTLAFFCVILLIAMVQAGLKDGIKEALSGSCGCFGEAGLPASVMLLVDGLLLASAIFLIKPDMMAPTGLRGRVPVWLPAIAGVIAMVAVVKPEVPNTEGTQPTPPAIASTAWPDPRASAMNRPRLRPTPWWCDRLPPPASTARWPASHSATYVDSISAAGGVAANVKYRQAPSA